jgi:predicted NUDIX family NTP pyrophosphohydrolase
MARRGSDRADPADRGGAAAPPTSHRSWFSLEPRVACAGVDRVSPLGGSVALGGVATIGTMTDRISAGILLFRRAGGRLEVLLAHPGGPRFASRDAGHWTVPKGEVEPGEALEAVALREFEEETGHRLGAVELIPLGDTTQKGGKVVHAWAAEGDLDPDEATSNSFITEWPAGSGELLEVPEIDRVAWFELAAARVGLKASQVVFIDRLEAHLIMTGEAPDR